MRQTAFKKIMPPQDETLRYMGYSGQELTVQFGEELDICRKKIFDAASPKAVYSKFALKRTEQGIAVLPTALVLSGNDISKLLDGCDECVLIAVTLGLQVERLINYTQAVSMSRAVMMDAAAAAMVEAVCDELENNLRQEVESEGKNLTWRYSCGYGDLPLSLQKDFTAALDTSRRIGLSCSENYIMIPRKSVTAVMGIGKKTAAVKPACEQCVSKDGCQLRKAGKSCGYKKQA